MTIEIVKSMQVCGVPVESLEDARKVIMDTCEQCIGKSLASMMPAEYSELIRELDKMGFFALRGAAVYLSKRLGISKVTVYKSLKKNNIYL